MADSTVAYECLKEPSPQGTSESERGTDHGDRLASRRQLGFIVLACTGLLFCCTQAWWQLPLPPATFEYESRSSRLSGFRQAWKASTAKVNLVDTNLRRNASSKGECELDTGGTCHIMGCNGNRGPTHCVSGHCLCRPNYCSMNGRCEQNADSLCTKNTGGTCYMFSCSSSLGPTNCDGGHCMCQDEYCADYEGRCHPSGQCTEQTGGTCRVFNCHEDRGPTRCFNGMCICYPGYCAQDGQCILAETKLNAYVWGTNQTYPHFPKPAVPGTAGENLNIALSVSGGGARSLSFSMGVLRALEDLGLMGKFDAISSVSGGTWAMAIYMFAHGDHDDKDLLGCGASTPTSDLTMDILKKDPPAMGKAVTGTMRYFMESLWTTTYKADKLWIDYVSQIILAPVGLDRLAIMAGSDQQLADTKRRNPFMEAMDWRLPRQDRARVFVMNGAIMSPEGYENAQDDIVSLQMSPDWTGSPFFPDGKTKNMQYTLSHSQSDLKNLKGLTSGGGFLESFAFGSSAPQTQYGESKPKSMGAPDQFFSLPNAVGTSSCALAGYLALSAKTSYVTPLEQIWPVSSEPQKEIGYSLGDGGMIDNAGVLSMMQRGVKKIVWLINTDTGLLDGFDWCGPDPKQASFDPNEAPVKITNQVSDKFGYGISNAEGYYANNQVFAKDQLAEVACELQKIKQSQLPLVLRKSLKVQPNSWWGIRAYDVEMLFVYLERSMRFEGAIKNQRLKYAISKGARKLGGKFNNFPFFKTTFQNGHSELTQYTNEQVNLLAALGEYYIQMNKDLFISFLGR